MMPHSLALITCLLITLSGVNLRAAAPDSVPEFLLDPATGQYVARDATGPVLQYNYRTVEPGALLAKIAEGNRIYARSRSDYLHPLHGVRGEVLTHDWAIDHPHHRGIYWAWPEVGWGTRRGDLHALQQVFARPVDNVRHSKQEGMAVLEAQNQWVWEDRTPIVKERALFRVYPISGRGRAIDLEFEFTPLVDEVTLARRDTRLYGGLNLRLASPANPTLQVHTDPPGAAPRRAWSDLSGIFEGTVPSGLSVLQHRDNPEYPGDWIQYPELAWCQPAFPSANTRYSLRRGTSLVLRYRIWTHDGPAPSDREAASLWDAYHAPNPSR
ncbi:MAG: PmoA family protein [Verrucomicrobiales bacterium]|nr:PmoA family protein [Verrucomicrobiales bacterium]